MRKPEDLNKLLGSIDKGSRFTKLCPQDELRRGVLTQEDYHFLVHLFEKIADGQSAVIIVTHDGHKKKYMLAGCDHFEAFDMMHAVEVDLLKKTKTNG